MQKSWKQKPKAETKTKGNSNSNGKSKSKTNFIKLDVTETKSLKLGTGRMQLQRTLNDASAKDVRVANAVAQSTDCWDPTGHRRATPCSNVVLIKNSPKAKIPTHRQSGRESERMRERRGKRKE